MKHQHRLLSLLLGVLLASPVGAEQLQGWQGRYFRAGVPAGWQAQETQNGVEIVAPDGLSGAVFGMLLGGFGQMTPRNYLYMALQQGPYTNPQIDSIRDLPDQPGVMGYNWKVIEAQVRFGYRGVPVRATVVTGVIQGAGQYSAALRAYQAPLERWGRLEPLLAAVDRSIVITNARDFAGSPQMHLPRGIRHDEIYGSYNKGYSDRAASSDRNSQRRWEGASGRVRMKDPVTGQIHELPQEAYDAGRGGYVNPNRPTELLEPAAPGE